VLVYVSEPVPYDAPQRLLQAWKRAHHSRLEGYAVQAALREQDGLPRLLAVTRLPAAQASAPALKQAVQALSRWLDDARAD
jgi:type III secretion system chaperone SycN